MTSTERPGTWRSLVRSMRSWRTASVTLLSFASGMPLGLVWIAIPDWMRSIGVDIKTVGLLTLVQAPWTFKFLWAPLMDRYVPGFWGRRRGWIALAQIALFAGSLALAGLGDRPEAAWVVGAVALSIAFASASQDIAYDAYTVDVLRPEEQGIAVGAKTAAYRAAMFVAGGLAISAAARIGWGWVNAILGVLYLGALLITWRAPEPAERPVAPRSLRDAVWEPFVGFLGRPRALEILAFVVFYKFADNVAQALLRPFLFDMGYSADDRGFALATIGNVATLTGTFIGGAATATLGLGRSLWTFGFLQIFSNIGYVLVAQSDLNRPLMYSAMGFESFTQGLGVGAFSVLLLRLTQKRFSATQYALFSSLFGVPRLLSGPIAGTFVDAIGWVQFFWISMLMGIPGMILLGRFVPWRDRDPQFTVDEPTLEAERDRDPARSRAGPSLVGRFLIGTATGLVAGTLLKAALNGLKGMRATPPVPFDLTALVEKIYSPARPVEWVEPVGLVVFALVVGLAAAAIAAGRARQCARTAA